MGKEDVASSDIRAMSALPDANSQALVLGKHALMHALLPGNCNCRHRAVRLAQRAVSLGTDAGQNKCVQNNAAFAHNLPMRAQPRTAQQKLGSFYCAARGCSYVMAQLRLNARTARESTIEAG